jgi:DNA-binding transcriptional LysR family regulator
MDFTYLRTFCEVAKCGNFTHAAEALGYAQSSVTIQIQKLEAQYGVALFERRGRRMHLTHAGQLLLPYAQQILALYAEAKAQLAEQQTGTITIGSIESVAAHYLPPMLRTVREISPRLSITLQVGTEASILRAVRLGECDLGLILDHVAVREEPEEVEYVPLRKEEFVFVLPARMGETGEAYPHTASLAAQDLAHARLLLTEEGCTYRAALLHALQQAGIPYQLVGEMSSVETIKHCVKGGLGIGFLPRFTVDEDVAQGTLQAIPYAGPSKLYTQAVYLKRKWRSRAVEQVLTTLGQVRVS